MTEKQVKGRDGMPGIILASASPRRRELLGLTGLEFQVMPAKGEEVITESVPSRIVEELALGKASEVAARLAEEAGGSAPGPEGPGRAGARQIVIGADTIVEQDGRILGKPRDRQDAFRMIASLQGREHAVYTGVALLALEEGQVSEREVFSVRTSVFVNPMEPEDIRAYLDTGEADDKAGAYGIQGRFGIWVDHIEGDYNNVVGLPVSALWTRLRKLL